MLYEMKMQAANPKAIDLYIYSDVESDYYDWWTGETVESNTSANHFRNELEAAGDVTQINIYINSLGGSVMEGVAIYNQLRCTLSSEYERGGVFSRFTRKQCSGADRISERRLNHDT
mgnify:CR=1 FL=1